MNGIDYEKQYQDLKKNYAELHMHCNVLEQELKKIISSIVKHNRKPWCKRVKRISYARV